MQQSTQRLTGQDSSSQENSQKISSWMDGDEQAAMPASLKTASGLETWQLYHLIGDALRTPELAQPLRSDFASRVSAAIALEPTVLAPTASRAPEPVGWMRRYGLPSFAMAAAVASVVWVARPFFIPEMSGINSQIAAGAQLNRVASRDDAASMQNYVSAHRQISGPTAVRQVAFGASR